MTISGQLNAGAGMIFNAEVVMRAGPFIFTNVGSTTATFFVGVSFGNVVVPLTPHQFVMPAGYTASYLSEIELPDGSQLQSFSNTNSVHYHITAAVA